MHLQLLDLGCQILFVGQQDRHGDKRAKVGGNTLFQRQTRQRFWPDQPRDHQIDQCSSRFKGDSQTGHCKGCPIQPGQP